MTIKDIARLSGYAVGTVSRVLNGSPNVSEEARSRIMAVVEEHHFKLNNNATEAKAPVYLVLFSLYKFGTCVRYMLRLI